MPRITDAADATPEATADGCDRRRSRGKRPDGASRARTLAAHAASGLLELPGQIADEPVVPAARTVESDGSILMMVPPEIGAAVLTSRDDVAAVLHLVDVAPVAVPQRVRAHCWVAGWLSTPSGSGLGQAAARLAAATHDPALLASGGSRSGAVVRLEPGEVLVDDLWGAEHVEPDAYGAAAADPVAVHEAELLQHLASAHSAELYHLCRLADAAAKGDHVAPVALDRYGLRLRCTGPTHTRDVRFEFTSAVTGPATLGEALRRLFHGPGAPESACA